MYLCFEVKLWIYFCLEFCLIFVASFIWLWLMLVCHLGMFHKSTVCYWYVICCIFICLFLTCCLFPLLFGGLWCVLALWKQWSTLWHKNFGRDCWYYVWYPACIPSQVLLSLHVIVDNVFLVIFWNWRLCLLACLVYLLACDCLHEAN